METRVIAIVPAAGLGKRFEASTGKTFAVLDGIPLLVHTLKRLNRDETVQEIIPVLRPEDLDYGFELARGHNLSKISRIAPGGRERQDSIFNALNLIEGDGAEKCSQYLVLIHDGARPFIPEGTIERLIEQLHDADGAAPGTTPKDTLKEVSADETILSTVDRDKIRAIQTPQAFPFPVIKKAYDKAYHEGYYATDDAALVENAGGKVKIISGSPFNIKITTVEDLQMVELLLANGLISS